MKLTRHQGFENRHTSGISSCHAVVMAFLIQQTLTE